MLSYEESLKILKDTNALIEGHFILSSGLHSSKYVQCAQLLSKPEKAYKICNSLAEKIESSFNDFDLILSPAMGGVIIGYELGKILKKETIFSERVNGQFKLRRDFVIQKNNKVLIVEDVITTGKSSLECSNLVEASGAFLVGYACIINRSNGKSNIKEKIVSQIDLNIPTYTKDDLPNDLSNIFHERLSTLPTCSLMGWWLNVNEKGDFNVLHTHPLANASIVFYLTDNHGSLIFQHPSSHSRWAFIKAFNERHATRFFANAGDMLVFPADLEHCVEPNERDEPRISISMNLKFNC